MKLLAIIALLGMLIGCNQNNAPPITNSNGMSGTWRHTQVHDFHNVETDEYLYTEYIESTLIINEDSGDIRVVECWDYGSPGQIGIKTNDYFYLDQGTRAFRLNSDGSYSTSEEERIQNPGMIATYFNKHFDLEKISTETVIDKGNFVISGPIEIAENDHVCSITAYTNVFEAKRLQLLMPYDDRWLELSLGFNSAPEVGEISYTRFAQEPVLFEFRISSNASLFRETVGSNLLNINSADINITESSDSTLSGTYSFVANNNETYSGEFLVDLRE